MSMHTVTRTCGCTGEHELLGPYKTRERRIAWMAATPCRNCWHEALMAPALAEARRLGRPELTGTPRQIAKALVIRESAVARARKLTNEWAMDCRRSPTPWLPSALVGLVAAERWLAAALTDKIEARWWIKTRDYLEWRLSEVAKAAARSTGASLSRADMDAIESSENVLVRELAVLVAQDANAA